MDNNIFRKKSIDRVTNPEQLNDYIKVSNPSVWIILMAIIVFLIGVCAWGYLGRLETKISVPCEVVNGEFSAFVKEDDVDKLFEGMTIKVKGTESSIEKISKKALNAKDNLDEYMMHLGNINEDEWVFRISGVIVLEDGIYLAEVIIESIAPMSFVLN